MSGDLVAPWKHTLTEILKPVSMRTIGFGQGLKFPWQPAMVKWGDQPELVSPRELQTHPNDEVAANNAITTDKYTQKQCSRSVCVRFRSANELIERVNMQFPLEQF
jgi:hypothetical protein